MTPTPGSELSASAVVRSEPSPKEGFSLAHQPLGTFAGFFTAQLGAIDKLVQKLAMGQGLPIFQLNIHPSLLTAFPPEHHESASYRSRHSVSSRLRLGHFSDTIYSCPKEWSFLPPFHHPPQMPPKKDGSLQG